MTKIKNVLVFCGSSTGSLNIFKEQAVALGQRLAQEERTLIYGGGRIGLMGLMANACLEKGGQVIGIIPSFLSTKEIEHNGLSELYIVETMHERKAKMLELADAIIAMPGGYGTLEELFEAMTWAQLGLHQKPIGLLNVNGYYDLLISQAEKMVHLGFLKQDNLDMMLHSSDIEDLIEKLENYVAPPTKKWLSDLSKT